MVFENRDHCSHFSVIFENRDHCSHFSVIFETANKFLIVFVGLILGEKGADGVTGTQWENDITYEFNLKVILKGLGCK